VETHRSKITGKGETGNELVHDAYEISMTKLNAVLSAVRLQCREDDKSKRFF
jgi:hypothetical protein